MRIQFNEVKATQAAAKYLQLAGGKLNYLILIKLLYLLDRKALIEWGTTITRAECFSMKLGPVLSEVHDLITEPESPKGFWQTHISPSSNYSVTLLKDPGVGKLSKGEEQFIDEVWSQFGGYTDPFKLADDLHKMLPEWTEVTQGRVGLPYSDILSKAGGIDAADIRAILRDLESSSEDQSALAIAWTVRQMLDAGSTFLLPKSTNDVEHLWILLTNVDLENRAVCVNVTQRRFGSDPTVILLPGDHPFIYKESVVKYDDARFIDIGNVLKLLQNGRKNGFVAEQRENCTHALLDKIRKGLLASNRTPNEIREHCESLGW